jgi:hypothetical protein
MPAAAPALQAGHGGFLSVIFMRKPMMEATTNSGNELKVVC